jgi:hypothetical protein
VERPLWREDGSVFCTCCWPLPAQSFSGPSPLVLATIFYCLRFEISLFIASYDSQGHGGGIRPRLHTVYKVSIALRPRSIAPARTAQEMSLPLLRVFSLTFPQSCSLAMAIVLSPVYTAVPWQRIYMWTYFTFSLNVWIISFSGGIHDAVEWQSSELVTKPAVRPLTGPLNAY